MVEEWKWTAESKLCFVTTGATAPFVALIQAVLQPSTLDALQSLGYTHLLIQYGEAKRTYDDSFSKALAHFEQTDFNKRLVIDGMDFNREGLKTQFLLVQQSKGLCISHAGSGSILEALRFQIPLIVAPNTGLLDNHQEELASVMERNKYLLRGDVKDLSPAIKKSEDFRNQMSQFPPITSGKHRETKSFAAVMDETLGFMD